jgi:putative transposase
MLVGEPYFWTSTINDWRHLLGDDKIKEIPISSLQTLTERKLIEVYGFVIMPNHIYRPFRA